jgi:hypothetical protein
MNGSASTCRRHEHCDDLGHALAGGSEDDEDAVGLDVAADDTQRRGRAADVVDHRASHVDRVRRGREIRQRLGDQR